MPKPPARMGRPPVDSEMVRSRLERRLLDRLDSYIAATPDVTTRSEAVRAILAAWLDGLGGGPVELAGGQELSSELVPSSEPAPVVVVAGIPYVPSEAAIERVARIMFTARERGDPDGLDGKGVAAWRRYHPSARTGLLQHGRDL